MKTKVGEVAPVSPPYPTELKPRSSEAIAEHLLRSTRTVEWPSEVAPRKCKCGFLLTEREYQANWCPKCEPNRYPTGIPDPPWYERDPMNREVAPEGILKIVPLTLKQANKLVQNWHRHHKPVIGHRFSIGVEHGGKLVGAAIVGRPQARMVSQYDVAEVTRLVTDGTKSACSKLYGACARIAREMGFASIRTAILESEPGTSLKASGWAISHTSDGGDWNRPSRSGRRTDQPMCKKQVWVKELNDVE